MLTDEEFRLFRSLIYEESGIYLKETRKDFLENRLIKRMTATGMNSPYWYYKFITEKSKKELLILLGILTINETSFFRNRPQIDLFKNIILPELVVKKGHKGEKRLRIWSSGCSTGEEPYTIAMVLMETVPYHWLWDIKIYASDLSINTLEIANRGEYSKDKVHATVDDYYINKYFEKIIPLPSDNPFQPIPHPFNTPIRKMGYKGIEEGRGDFKEDSYGDGIPLIQYSNGSGLTTREQKNGKHYKIKYDVKKLIVFDYHNLKNENGLTDLDVIFCRNVMIYFDEEEQKRLIEKLYRKLNHGGYLFLGHAESLHGWDTGFKFVYKDKGTAYKKAEGI